MTGPATGMMHLHPPRPSNANYTCDAHSSCMADKTTCFSKASSEDRWAPVSSPPRNHITGYSTAICVCVCVRSSMSHVAYARHGSRRPTRITRRSPCGLYSKCKKKKKKKKKKKNGCLQNPSKEAPPGRTRKLWPWNLGHLALAPRIHVGQCTILLSIRPSLTQPRMAACPKNQHTRVH